MFGACFNNFTAFLMEKIPTPLPVVRWGTSFVRSEKLGLIRIAYRTEPGQSDHQAVESPIYAMSPEQMRAMAEALTRVADDLDGGNAATLAWPPTF